MLNLLHLLLASLGFILLRFVLDLYGLVACFAFDCSCFLFTLLCLLAYFALLLLLGLLCYTTV